MSAPNGRSRLRHDTRRQDGRFTVPLASLRIEVVDAESMRQLLDRLSAEDVETGELFENDGRVALHCWDPHGYQVEVFWAASSDQSTR
jgi:hypothetical protein